MWLKKYFDTRDAFVLFGFILLYTGLAGCFSHYVAMGVIGGIILLKGLPRQKEDGGKFNGTR